MPGFSDSVEQAVLSQVLLGVPYPYGIGDRLSLHTADPGDTGVNEVTGGSYARQTGAWNAPVGGVSTLVANVDFPGMPAVTVTHYGVWTSAGAFVGSGSTTTLTLAAGSTYRLTSATSFALS